VIIAIGEIVELGRGILMPEVSGNFVRCRNFFKLTVLPAFFLFDIFQDQGHPYIAWSKDTSYVTSAGLNV